MIVTPHFVLCFESLEHEELYHLPGHTYRSAVWLQRENQIEFSLTACFQTAQAYAFPEETNHGTEV